LIVSIETNKGLSYGEWTKCHHPLNYNRRSIPRSIKGKKSSPGIHPTQKQLSGFHTKFHLKPIYHKPTKIKTLNDGKNYE